MGERKGQNKYYPPDYDPKKGSLNAFLGTHALRDRAKKIHLGILVIRFEMPFNIWCEGCKNHVARGVRYNAEKKKVGMYFTTPVYEFRMKCHLCDNYYVIRTDPEKFDYELVEGCRRQERRWEPQASEQVVPSDKETSVKLASDAMYKLEHGEEDALKLKSAAPNLERLEQLQSRMKDDFSSNQELRRIFRTNKKADKATNEANKMLLDKSSLDIELLPETKEDVRMAQLIAQYRTVASPEERLTKTRAEIEQRSIFSKRSSTSTDDTPSTSTKAVKRLRESLIAKSNDAKVAKLKSNPLSRSALGVRIKGDDSSQPEEDDRKLSSEFERNGEEKLKPNDSHSVGNERIADSDQPSIAANSSKEPLLANGFRTDSEQPSIANSSINLISDLYDSSGSECST